MALDIFTGCLKGFKLHKWNSQKAYPFKKFAIIAGVIVGYLLDSLLEMDYIGKFCAYYAIGVEGLSICENLSAMGVGFPSFITKFFEQMKNKGDDK